MQGASCGERGALGLPIIFMLVVEVVIVVMMILVTINTVLLKG